MFGSTPGSAIIARFQFCTKPRIALVASAAGFECNRLLTTVSLTDLLNAVLPEPRSVNVAGVLLARLVMTVATFLFPKTLPRNDR
jgi:hypothetical protein